MHFLENVLGAKNLVGVVQVTSGVEPHPEVRRPVQVKGESLLPWSYGRSIQNLARLLPALKHRHYDVIDPGPWTCGSSGPKALLFGFKSASELHFWSKLIEQKMLGIPKGIIWWLVIDLKGTYGLKWVGMRHFLGCGTLCPAATHAHITSGPAGVTLPSHPPLYLETSLCWKLFNHNF